MQYLEILNKVLTRNGLNAVDTINSTSEPRAAEAKAYINEVYQDIINQSLSWSWREKEGTIHIEAGVSSYELPEDCDTDSIKEIRYVDTLKTITQLSYNEFDQIVYPYSNAFILVQNQETIDRPEFAYIFEQKIHFYPIPSANSILKFRYQIIPEDLNADEDTPIFPRQYHYLLIIGASALLRTFPLNNTGGAATDQQLYNNGLALMRKNNRSFFGNKPSLKLRYTPRYFRG